MNAAGSNEQKKVNGAMEVRSEVQKPLFLFSFFFFFLDLSGATEMVFV